LIGRAGPGEIQDLGVQAQTPKPKPLSAKRERFSCGVGMDLVIAVEYLEALLVLAIFILILATGFKVWRWNYMIPPR
jgi:hypothetical protein